MTEKLHFHISLSCIGEGHGNPLRCSCLENPRDGEAWWAAVSGVTQSRTRLKRLSSSSSSVTVVRRPAGPQRLFRTVESIRTGRGEIEVALQLKAGNWSEVGGFGLWYYICSTSTGLIVCLLMAVLYLEHNLTRGSDKQIFVTECMV